MGKTKLPTFKGDPLVEILSLIPHCGKIVGFLVEDFGEIKILESIPKAGFLQGDFGKAFLKEYNGRVKADYNGNPNLNVLRYDNGVVKGSTPFAVVLANQILREENLRTATQVDLEKALRIWDIPRTCEDTGLVLRSEEDEYSKNTPLAKDLAEQVKGRGIKFSPKNPVMIPLIGLELEKADNGYGLTFKLREGTEIYEAPILNERGSFDSKDINEKIGLPKKLSIFGDRSLYTRNSGLSKLYLVSGLDLYSNNRYLDGSLDIGRVVCCKC